MYLPALLGNGIRSGLIILIFMQFFKGLPKELEDEDIDTIWNELQDDISCVDCGELYSIDSEPLDLEEE